MSGWRSTDGPSDGDGRPRTDGGTGDEDDSVADIKRMLSEGDDDGGLADAVGEGEEAADEEYEGGPAMDVGLKLGAPFALVAVGLLFVGPQPLLEFDPTGRYVIDTLDVGGPGNIAYISAATLALSFLSGLLYPSFADELDDDFKMDLGLGLSLPTVAAMALGVLFFALWPVLFDLLNGAFVDALITLVVVIVLLAIAVAGSVVTLVVAAIATLYFVGPALVGSYVGGFVGERIAT